MSNRTSGIKVTLVRSQIGIKPKQRGTLRAPWPLLPRPAVLPPLPPMPRATRRLARCDPGAGFRSWTFTGAPPP